MNYSIYQNNWLLPVYPTGMFVHEYICTNVQNITQVDALKTDIYG